MTESRDKIFKALGGSSPSTPVHIDNLRQRVGKIDGDLEDLLEDMYAEHIVNRSSGMKEGKSFTNYWLTGLQQAALQPFKAMAQPSWPLQNSRQKGTAKVQPNTSTNPIKEQNMPKKPTNGKKPGALNSTILRTITEQPGIARETLLEYAVKTVPGATSSKAKSTIGNLIAKGKIRIEGKRGHSQYFAKDAPASKPIATAAAPVIPQPKPIRRDKPVLDQKPPADETYQVAGMIKITNGKHTMELDHNNAILLIRAIRQQLPFTQRLRLWLT